MASSLKHLLTMASLALVMACTGTESGNVAPFESTEVCGTSGPHKLMALEPHQFPRSISIHRDRFILNVDDPNRRSQDDGNAGSPIVYAADRCGKDLRTLAEGMEGFALRPEGPLLGLGETMVVSKERSVYPGTLYEIDPQGQRPPRPLVENLRRVSFTSKGLLVTTAAPGEDAGSLVFISNESPRPEPQNLGDGMIEGPWIRDPLRKAGSSLGPVLAGEDQVLALKPNRDLVAIHLDSAVSTTIAHDVATFALSSTGRHVIVQHLAPDEDPDTAAISASRPATLHNLATGASTDLGVNLDPFFVGSLARLETSDDGTSSVRFVDPKSMNETDLPDGFRPEGALADGDLYGTVANAIVRVSPGSTEAPRVLWTGPARIVEPLESGLLLLVFRSDPSTWDSDEAPPEVDLWFVSYSGDASRLLEREPRLTRSSELPDGRILIATPDSLYLADPSGETQRVTRWTGDVRWGSADPLVPGAFVYGKSGDDAGFYLAQPAPR